MLTVARRWRGCSNQSGQAQPETSQSHDGSSIIKQLGMVENNNEKKTDDGSDHSKIIRYL
jgi:hypothetical protein